jgi:hypothetical protein
MCSEKTIRERRGVGINSKNDKDITEVFAKKLDTKMVGPQVIWNDPTFPPPEGRGYTIAKNIAKAIDEIRKGEDNHGKHESKPPKPKNHSNPSNAAH